MTTMLVNDLTALSVMLTIPSSGCWVAEVDVDPSLAGVLPSGKVTLKIQEQILPCTVDPAGSGKFGEKASLRLVGGFGWMKPVLKRDYHNPAGVLSSSVFSTAAAEVGEPPPVDASPEVLPAHYVRGAGPASRVLSGRSWFVDLKGVTQVGPHIPTPASPGVTIVSYDPLTRTVQAASDEIITPGTILTDARFGVLHVRDVEQSWGEGGARATLFCSTEAVDPNPMGRLAKAVQGFVRATVQPEFLQLHKYTVVSQKPDGKLILQSKVKGPVPDVFPVSVWPGMSGVRAKVLPSSTVLVAFIDHEPIVVGFDDSTPLELSLDALKVSVGLGTFPVLMATPAFLQWITAVTTAINLLAPGSATPPVDMASTKLFAS